MAQLDITTFLSQVFWLILLFFVFYISFLKYILPELSKAIKLRNEKMNQTVILENSIESNLINVFTNFSLNNVYYKQNEFMSKIHKSNNLYDQKLNYNIVLKEALNSWLFYLYIQSILLKQNIANSLITIQETNTNASVVTIKSTPSIETSTSSIQKTDISPLVSSSEIEKKGKKKSKAKKTN